MEEFKNILSRVKIKKQEVGKDNKVLIKKVGRPALSNKKYFQFRLDEQLHAQFSKWAKQNHMGKSNALAQAILLIMKNNSV